MKHVVLVPTRDRPEKLSTLLRSIHKSVLLEDEELRKAGKKPLDVEVNVVDDSTSDRFEAKNVAAAARFSASHVEMRHVSRSQQQALFDEVQRLEPTVDVRDYVEGNVEGAARNKALLFVLSRYKDGQLLFHFFDDDVILKRMTAQKDRKPFFSFAPHNCFFSNIEHYVRANVPSDSVPVTLSGSYSGHRDIALSDEAEEIAESIIASHQKGVYRQCVDAFEKGVRHTLQGWPRLQVFIPSQGQRPSWMASGGNTTLNLKSIEELPFPISRQDDIMRNTTILKLIKAKRSRHALGMHDLAVAHVKQRKAHDANAELREVKSSVPAFINDLPPESHGERGLAKAFYLHALPDVVRQQHEHCERKIARLSAAKAIAEKSGDAKSLALARHLQKWVEVLAETTQRAGEVAVESTVTPFLNYGLLIKNWPKVVKAAKSFKV